MLKSSRTTLTQTQAHFRFEVSAISAVKVSEHNLLILIEYLYLSGHHKSIVCLKVSGLHAQNLFAILSSMVNLIIGVTYGTLVWLNKSVEFDNS